MPVRAKHWECADGRKFDDRKAATRHERWLELVELCSCVLMDHLGLSPHEDSHRAHSMAEGLLSHSAELRRILRADPIEGGGEESHRGDDKLAEAGLGPGVAKCGKGGDDGK